jgi:hypothetical protein
MRAKFLLINLALITGLLLAACQPAAVPTETPDLAPAPTLVLPG